MGRYLFRLPDVGEGTAEAEIVAWHVNPGDKVEEDDPLVDVMTEKATVEITSPVSGVVLEANGVPGDIAPVGSVLAVLETEGAGETAPAHGQTETERPAPEPEQRLEHAPAEAKLEPGPGGNYVFRLPDVGEGTAEAEVVAWHVKPGDVVEEDQPLVDVMTDKATVEITSPVSGTVVSVHGEPGQMAPVGSTLAVLQVQGEGNAARSPEPARESAPVQATTKPEPAPATAKPAKPSPPREPSRPAPPSARVPGERPLASPAVRRRAEELGIKLQFVQGTGPAGRITHQDLDAYLASGGAHVRAGAGSPRYAEKTGEEQVKVIGLRRRIAQQMQEAKRRIPHFMYAEEVDVTELENLRVHLNATKRPDQPKLTLLPFLIRALVRVLPNYPQINARFDDEAGVVTRYEAVHVGMATQTPNGLIVPVIRHAEAKDIWALAEEIARLAKATREGTAAREELSGSTITLTSLGPLGGLVHTPVINHPEVAIIGPNKIVERPVVHHGQVVVRKMMNVSSSFDHRVVDGWDAASMIQELKGLLEYPATLFMD